MKFKASLGVRAKVITFFTTVVFLSILFMLFCQLLATGFDWRTILAIAFLLFAYSAFYINGIIGYLVTNDMLIIRRPLAYKSITINRHNITSIQQINSSDISGSLRRFGIGGVFGYHGTFENSKLGTMLLYITRIDNLVLIRTANNLNIIVSPDDIVGFLSAIQ